MSIEDKKQELNVLMTEYSQLKDKPIKQNAKHWWLEPQISYSPLYYLLT